MFSQTTKPNLPQPQSSIKIYDVNLSTPIETTSSKTPPSKRIVPAISQPSPQVPTNIIENENLARERFQKAVTDEDINVCYDMSLKDFEHSGVHYLFKVIVFASSLKIHTHTHTHTHTHIYIYIYIYYLLLLLLLLF